MDQAAMTAYITETFADVEMTTAMGYHFFFHGPDHKHPFATLAFEDSEYEQVSQLDRPGVYRLNIGISADSYRSMFGPHPATPGESGIIDTGHDFTALDQLMPHPVYAPQSWVCVLNPGETTLQTVKTLLAEAYARLARRHSRSHASDDA